MLLGPEVQRLLPGQQAPAPARHLVLTFGWGRALPPGRGGGLQRGCSPFLIRRGTQAAWGALSLYGGVERRSHGWARGARPIPHSALLGDDKGGPAPADGARGSAAPGWSAGRLIRPAGSLSARSRAGGRDRPGPWRLSW